MQEIQKQNSGSPHSLAEREAHREWIAGRALTLLSHYWRDDDPVELTAAIGRDWADVLEGLPQEFIQRAAIKFQQKFPSKKPTPAAIYALTVDLMPIPFVVVSAPPPEPKRERVSRDVANEIVAKAGYAPKRFGGPVDAE